MRHAREIALTEVWLDARSAAMEPSLPSVAPAWDWPSIIGAALGVVGLAALAFEYWRVW
jgi:hypothetical protein